MNARLSQQSWPAKQKTAGSQPHTPLNPRTSVCERSRSIENARHHLIAHATRSDQQKAADADAPASLQPQQLQQQPQRDSSVIEQNQEQPQQQLRLLQNAFQDPPIWPAFLGTLFQQGALLGPLLDGIHSRVGLQVYDVAPITLGPLPTSLLVPPLLGTFYIVLGLLTVAADGITSGPATAAAQERASDGSSVGFLALNFGALAAALALSASLYESQQPASVIFAALAAVTALNWALFDRTKQGLALAALCGLGAPAAEVVLMAATHCWHYTRADVAGVFVSWVPWCYAFYTPAVSNLARYLWATCRPPAEGATGSS